MYVAREKMTDRKDKSDNGTHLIVLAKTIRVITTLLNS